MSGWAIGSALGVAMWMLALLFAIGQAQAHHCEPGTHCKKLKPRYERCDDLHPTRKPDRLFCEIRRAADHFGQSRSEMKSVAWCESRYAWWISGAHEGAFQYLWSTWNSLPYHRHSPYNPRWAAMQTAFAWSIGRKGEWACAY